MVAPSFPVVAPVDVTNLPSATRHSLIPDLPNQSFRKSARSFPKSARILRSSDFRLIYDTGKRYSCAHFAAFYLGHGEAEGSRLGFTTPRALGRANIRNRVKRRFREAVRLHLAELSPKWSVVINPRRSSLEIPFPALEKEIQKLFGHLSRLVPQGPSSPSSAYIK